MQMNEDQVTGCWAVFRGIAWGYSVSSSADAQLFYKFGQKNHLSTSFKIASIKDLVGPDPMSSV